MTKENKMAGTDMKSVAADMMAAFERNETGLALSWQAGAGELQSFVHADRAGLPWPVAHLRGRKGEGESTVLSWLPRGGWHSRQLGPARPGRAAALPG